MTMGARLLRYRSNTTEPGIRGILRSRIINPGLNSGFSSIWTACSPSLATWILTGIEPSSQRLLDKEGISRVIFN